MPRNFAKRMYGPYFPYDHGRKHPEKDYKEETLEFKLEKFLSKIKKRFTRSSTS
jgi:hypothetical protein